MRPVAVPLCHSGPRVRQHLNEGRPEFTPMYFLGRSVIGTTSNDPGDVGWSRFWNPSKAEELAVRLKLNAGDCFDVFEGGRGQPLLFVSRTDPSSTADPRLEVWDLRSGATEGRPRPAFPIQVAHLSMTSAPRGRDSRRPPAQPFWRHHEGMSPHKQTSVIDAQRSSRRPRPDDWGGADRGATLRICVRPMPESAGRTLEPPCPAVWCERPIVSCHPVGPTRGKRRASATAFVPLRSARLTPTSQQTVCSWWVVSKVASKTPGSRSI
jgi:hypothetical protein